MNSIIPKEKNDGNTDPTICESKETSLLMIILDINPNQRIVSESSNILTQCLDSVIAFGNSHLMQKAQNKLAILSCDGSASTFMFPVAGSQIDIRQVDGQYEVFTLVEKTVKQNLMTLLANSDKTSVGSESLIAGAISMAVCYIARLERNKLPGSKVIT